MADSTKRLLTLSPYCTIRPNTGGTKRIHYLNRGYAHEGWSVLQISGASVRQGVRGLFYQRRWEVAPGYCEEVYFNPSLILFNRLLRRLGTAQIAASLLPRILRPSPRIGAEIARHRVILLEHPHFFDLAAPFLRKDHLVVLDAHNIEFSMFSHQLECRGLGRVAAARLLEVERRCMERADLIFVCSPNDKKTATAEFSVDPTRVHCAPNGVDLASAPFISENEREEAKKNSGIRGLTALFVGSLWPPNIQAANNILKLANKTPEVTYIVVGKVGNALPHQRPNNVIVTGLVNDLHPWLAVADFAINPVETGSGSNVKMFEYCAAGLPTISTQFGARGIDDSTGLAVVTCDLSEFPDRVCALAASSDLATRRRAARTLVEQKYGWLAIAKGNLAVIENALRGLDKFGPVVS